MARYLQEPSKNGVNAKRGGSAEADLWTEAHPAVWEHLSESQWESGAVRITSTVTMFVEEGLVKLCLRDRSSGRTAWVSARSLIRAWEALEAGLTGDTLEWRRDRLQKR